MSVAGSASFCCGNEAVRRPLFGSPARATPQRNHRRAADCCDRDPILSHIFHSIAAVQKLLSLPSTRVVPPQRHSNREEVTTLRLTNGFIGTAFYTLLFQED